MATRHVTQLLVRHVHGQLSPAQRARVINHVRTCDHCRAALVREERAAADLQREMPRLGQPTTAQLSAVWAGVWQEFGAPRRTGRPFQMAWLPGLSVMLAMVLAVIIALPMLTESSLRVEAAPVQALPMATASPTPGVIETDDATLPRALATEPGGARPVATVALATAIGATPAPMPAATVSPEASGGGRWQ